jgi:hypothetical protein
MNNIEGSLSKRLTAHVRQVATKAAFQRATLDFPSHLRVFHIFSQNFSSELRWRSAPSRADFLEQLPAAPTRVAFV